MRKRVCMLAAIVAAIVSTGAQESSGRKPALATEAMLIANERALYDAVAKGDRTAFVSLALLPEGIWTFKSGFIPMERLADGLEVLKLSKWELVNPRVTWLGDDSAVVLYVWTGTGTFDDQPLASATLASTSWTRRGGKWLAAHHQETDLVK
jgi:hypothetical protein